MKRTLLFFLILTFILAGCSPRQLTTEEKSVLYTAAVETVGAQLTADFDKIPTSTETLVPPTLAPTATITETLMPTPSPTPSWDRVGPGDVETLILMYNSTASSTDEDPFYQWESDTYIAVEDFRYQLKVLKDSGYTTIPISLLTEAIRNGAELPPKPLIITFEASHRNIYEITFPIMQEFGFTGTVFLVENYHNGKYMATSDQIKELIAAGWEIGSKGKTGEANLTTPGIELGPEISGSRLFLEEAYGVPVNIFSYPYATADGNVTSRVAEWGYIGAVGIFKATTYNLGNIYYLPRYEVLNTWTDEDFFNILPWKPMNMPVRDVAVEQPAQ
ncbi:MAG: polysaccharide deacetylase family protein [Anaerolineaceae bacterium]|nr:polysaccharide deacetylase family protein [Anaerolineaceae bacterium]